MNADDVGKFFTTNGEDIWRMIVYCAEPTATMQNVKTGEQVGGIIGSPILEHFVKLIPEKEIKNEHSTSRD